MKKFTIIAFISVLFPLGANAKNMIVNVPILNVRACPSTDCRILMKLYKGDKVKVENVKSGWAKIKNEDKESFVLYRSLRKSYMYILYYIIGIITGYIILAGIISSFNNRCQKCGKWNALYEVDKELLEKLKSNMRKTAYTRYKDHTTKREYIVPATLFRYKITKKCKYCGDTTTTIVSEKYEN